MLFNNPISVEKIDKLLAELWLSTSSVILDVGCGQGELILRVLQLFNCRAVGVDNDPNEIQKAKQKLKDYTNSVIFHERPFSDSIFLDQYFDACFSLGASHAFGEVGTALECALASLKKITKPGGMIIIGDGYWRKEPDSEYLTTTGIEKKELHSHSENIEIGRELGLECIYTIKASYDEWDHFEGAFWMSAEKELVQKPENNRLIEQVKKRRNWKKSYLRWGRSTMGFALYVFLIPPALVRSN